VETRAYIAERLHVAGLRGDNPFTTPALEEIHRVAAGVPRLINSVCDHALTLAYRRQVKKLDADYIHEAADELTLLESVLASPEPVTKAAEFPVTVTSAKV
jgi:general secretion pathway protein A